MTVVTVPGGERELLSLAQIACAAYDKSGGLAAIAAVKAAQPLRWLGAAREAAGRHSQK